MAKVDVRDWRNIPNWASLLSELGSGDAQRSKLLTMGLLSNHGVTVASKVPNWDGRMK